MCFYYDLMLCFLLYKCKVTNTIMFKIINRDVVGLKFRAFSRVSVILLIDNNTNVEILT